MGLRSAPLPDGAGDDRQAASTRADSLAIDFEAPMKPNGRLVMKEKAGRARMGTWRRRSRGLTLLETLVSLIVLVLLMASVIPTHVNNMVFNQTLWEQRLASRVIDAEVDRACDLARTAGNWAAILANPGPTGILGPFTFPLELISPTGTRSTALHPTYADLMELTVSVSWNSRGHTLTQQSPVYLISQAGLCAG